MSLQLSVLYSSVLKTLTHSAQVSVRLLRLSELTQELNTEGGREIED